MMDIFINILIVAVIAIPMGYFFMSGGSAQKKTKATFRQKASDEGLLLNEVGMWQKGMIGLDFAQKILCYKSTTETELTQIDLKGYKSCSVVKTHKNATNHSKTESVLKEINLVLSPRDAKNKEVKIQMYNSEVTLTVQNDLMLTNLWEQIINKNL